MSHPAVFLDRDGVINVERSFITRPEEIELIPGAGSAIRALNKASIPAVVVTNQSAVARGMITEAKLKVIHAHLEKLLHAEGAHLNGIFYSPFLPEAPVAAYRKHSDCRKPGPGLLFQAAKRLDLNLAASVMIGDSLRDIAAAHTAGLRAAYMVRTGHGLREIAQLENQTRIEQSRPDAVFDDLACAINYVLETDLHVST